MTLDDANNLIVSDWSDSSGGIKYASPDLTSGGLVLAFEDGVSSLLDNGFGEIHGSIVSKPIVTGSIGNNLVVYAMDEDFDLDGETFDDATSGNNIWRWDVGNATQYDLPPSLVIATGETSPTFLDLNVGVNAKIHYEPQFDKWYITQYRFDGNQTGLVVVTADGTDGMSPTTHFDSLDFSETNNLDGNTDLANIQDIFRLAGDATVSPDGTKLYLHRIGEFGGNSVIGTGAVVVIPLDAHGVPILQIDDNGTPGETSDDFLANVETITLINNDGAHTLGTSVKFDAAGNLYTTNSAADLLQVFSNGGNTLATTTSAGTFDLQILAGFQADFNNDGSVDGDDFLLWQASFNIDAGGDANGDGVTDGDDFLIWQAEFGSGNGSGSAAVPEPTSLLLLLAGASGLLATCRRREVRFQKSACRR